MYQASLDFMRWLPFLPSLIRPDSARARNRKDEPAGDLVKEENICPVNSSVANKKTCLSDEVMDICEDCRHLSPDKISNQT
jgi:hypothetical protein